MPGMFRTVRAEIRRRDAPCTLIFFQQLVVCGGSAPLTKKRRKIELQDDVGERGDQAKRVVQKAIGNAIDYFPDRIVIR